MFAAGFVPGLLGTGTFLLLVYHARVPLAGALVLIKLIMGRVWGPNSLRDDLTRDTKNSC